MERMATWQIALRRLEMPVPRFLFAFVLPAALAGLITAILLIFLTGGFSEGALFAGFTGIFLIVLLPLLTSGAAIYFPILEVNRSAIKIEKEMHMFITRMGILSLGEVGAATIFDILRQMKDYGELAQEVKRIETLVDKWHTSLPEAARIVAQQSPSPLWTDFLDRMAKTTGIKRKYLKKIQDKGLAAWRVGPRPGVTPMQWARGRVYAFVMAAPSSTGPGKPDHKLAVEAGVR